MKLPTEDDPIKDIIEAIRNTPTVPTVQETIRRFSKYPSIESVISIGSSPSGFIFRYRN